MFRVFNCLTVEHALTALSLMAAAAITSIGFAVSLAVPGRWAALAGGVVVGAGVGAMHYTGMWALEVPGRITWDLPLVASSVGLGMVFGAAALASQKRLIVYNSRYIEMYGLSPEIVKSGCMK